MICFTIKQSKVLLKKLYRGERDSLLLQQCELQNSIQDSIIQKDNTIIDTQKTYIDTLSYEINMLTEQQLQLIEKIHRRTKQRNVLGIIAIVLTLIVAL